MKEEALKLAVWLENMSKLGWADNFGQELDEISAMIRRLVQELDEKNYRILELTKRYKALTWNDKQSKPVGVYDGKSLHIYTPQTKPLSDEEITQVFDKCYPNNGDGDVVTLVDFARAIEERHGIK